VGELDNDGAKLHWFLYLMILHLPLAIWLFLMSTGLGVSDLSWPPWKQIELCDRG
jgi:cytochrome b561